jgi:Holliday junction resolvase RusA-like endonuclease
MVIRFYSLKNLTPVSKPRGQIGKYGNITHSSGGYRKFQQEVAERLRDMRFSIPGDFYALGYVFMMAKKRGHLNDVGNMKGAIEDILVKEKYLKDDNWRHLPRAWEQAEESNRFSITLIIFESVADVIYFLQANERLLVTYK